VKTRHAGLSVLLQTFNQKTEVPVKYRVRGTALEGSEDFQRAAAIPDRPRSFHDYRRPKRRILRSTSTRRFSFRRGLLWDGKDSTWHPAIDETHLSGKPVARDPQTNRYSSRPNGRPQSRVTPDAPTDFGVTGGRAPARRHRD